MSVENVKEAAFDVVDEIRQTSDVSWENSQVIAHRVLHILSSYEDLTREHIDGIKRALLTDVLDVDRCSDKQKFESMADRIGSMHADTQERSWSLHEEVDDVVEFLESLRKLVELADPRVPLRVFGGDSVPLPQLVELFQLEQRTPIQVALLRVLHCVACLSPTIADTLTTFSLPMDLARDVTSRAVSAPTTDRNQKTDEMLRLFAAIFSTGTPVTYQNKEAIHNHELLKLCCDRGMLGLNVLLAANLQYTPDEPNLVVEACFDSLSANPELGQDLIGLLNRGSDPVWPYASSCPRSDSVLKLTTDIVHCSTTSKSVFYDNDLVVLYDVCLREIRDLPLNERRTQYLKLLKELVKFFDADQKGEVCVLLGDIECRKADVDLVHDIVARCDSSERDFAI